MNKHALIIGGTRGTGKIVAEKLVKEGYKVSVSGRKEPANRNQNIDYFISDASEEKFIKEILPEIIRKNGNLDALIFLQRYRGDGNKWDGEIATSLTTTKNIIESSKDKFNEGSSIIFVSSNAGERVVQDQLVGYHVGKAGLIQMARYYAVMLAPKTRVNCVSPNTILKDENKDFYGEDFRAEYSKYIPMSRMCTPEDIANAISFFSGDKASFITGQNIILDGGASLIVREQVQKKNETITVRQDCRLCGSKNLELAFSLEPSPIADKYLTEEQHKDPKFEKSKELYRRQPLDLFLCKDCGHVQKLHIIDPEMLFGNYVFETSSSAGLIEHFRKASEKILDKTKKKDLFVAEIGSNDGAMLKFFKEKGHKVLGIDPARNIAEKANKNGIETLPVLFTSKLADEVVKKYGKADVVIANNVFAHIDNMRDVVLGIKNLLSPEGIFVFEVSYLVDTLDKMLFDTVYHEHLDYHSVKPMESFFKRNGLEFFDIELISSKGGSIRGYVQLSGGNKEKAPIIKELIDKEEKTGLGKAETFRKFSKEIDEKRNAVEKLILDIKARGETIAGYGVSHTANTLSYHFGLNRHLDFIVDDNPKKQGLYTPIYHTPIVSAEKLLSEKPDYVIILPWNYAQQIIDKNKAYTDAGGKFIVPLPVLKIV